jgi:hypothetical protein
MYTILTPLSRIDGLTLRQAVELAEWYEVCIIIRRYATYIPHTETIGVWLGGTDLEWSDPMHRAVYLLCNDVILYGSPDSDESDADDEYDD